MWSLGWMGFDTVTRSLLAARTIAGVPCSGPGVPERNTLGAVGEIEKRKASLAPPCVRRTISELPVIWNGNCALICVGETNVTWVITPFTVRQESARTVGSGTSVLERVMGLNWLPKMLTNPPRATGLVKSPALTTRSRTGGAVAAS